MLRELDLFSTAGAPLYVQVTPLLFISLVLIFLGLGAYLFARQDKRSAGLGSTIWTSKKNNHLHGPNPDDVRKLAQQNANTAQPANHFSPHTDFHRYKQARYKSGQPITKVVDQEGKWDIALPLGSRRIDLVNLRHYLITLQFVSLTLTCFLIACWSIAIEIVSSVGFFSGMMLCIFLLIGFALALRLNLFEWF